jgi:hypothetical protein
MARCRKQDREQGPSDRKPKKGEPKPLSPAMQKLQALPCPEGRDPDMWDRAKEFVVSILTEGEFWSSEDSKREREQAADQGQGPAV